MTAEWDESVDSLAESTGKSREQAEAFLQLVASAFRRRGWVEGEPLDQDQIKERLDTFLGNSEETGTTP